MLRRWIVLAVLIAVPGCGWGPTREGMYGALQREECRRRAQDDPRAATQPCPEIPYEEYERSRERVRDGARDAEAPDEPPPGAG